MKQSKPKRIRLTPADERKLYDNFELPGWQFDKLIGRQCRQVDEITICWQEGKRLTAIIFGLDAAFTETHKPCIGNFFIRYGNRAYQKNSIMYCMELIELLKKEAAENEYNEYKYQEWKQRKEQKEKAKKGKRKTKLKVVSKKAA